MDSTVLINLAPTTVAQTASSDDALPPGEASIVDFAALLAQGLAPEVKTEIPVKDRLTLADSENRDLSAGADAEQPYPVALLLPERLAITQTPQSVPMNPASAAATIDDVATGDNRAAVLEVSPEPAAKIAASGEWLPPVAADTASGSARSAITDAPSVSMSAHAPAVSEITMTGWPTTPSSAINQPGAAAMHRVEVPLSQPGWSDAFSSRIVWMAGQHQQSAELHVNPPELGPIDIVLSFERDQAHIHFSSSHSPVREAIETALPALRDALGQAGIQLGNTSVSAESFGRPGEFPDRGQGRHRQAGVETAGHAGVPDRPAAARIGLVDTFA